MTPTLGLADPKVGIALKCQYCGNNVDLPFRCPFCAGYFCPEHRLPENHACPELLRVRTQRPPAEEYRPPSGESKAPPLEKGTLAGYPFVFRKPRLTSSTETLHLAVSAVIVMGVGLSIHKPVYEWVSFLFREPLMFLISALTFAAMFLTHELAHKAAARHYGLWAEFRLSLMGALLTLISIAPIPLKFVSPGAVLIAGAADKKIVGITALSGPLTSIALTSLFFALYFLIPDGSFALMMLDAAFLSVWLALLNLIPYGILDGAKVFWWSKHVWAVSFSLSLFLGLAVLRYLLF